VRGDLAPQVLGVEHQVQPVGQVAAGVVVRHVLVALELEPEAAVELDRGAEVGHDDVDGIHGGRHGLLPLLTNYGSFRRRSACPAIRHSDKVGS
jgi:hypothetical protein